MATENLAQTAFREKHYTVIELATIWNTGDDKIRALFRKEPGVVHISGNKPGRRVWDHMLIPESVALRVYRRMRHE